jgi:hypothetical protein
MPVFNPLNTRNKRRVRPVLSMNGKTRTEQAHKDACDMNYIVRDYHRTQLLKHVNANEGRYDDVSQVDFQAAQDLIAETKSMFEQFPSSIRKEFDNSPSEFLKFARDPKSGKRMEELGITPGFDAVDARGSLIDSMQELVTEFKANRTVAEQVAVNEASVAD